MLAYCYGTVNRQNITVQGEWYQCRKFACQFTELMPHGAINREHTARNLATCSMGNMPPVSVTTTVEHLNVEIALGIRNTSAATVYNVCFGNGPAGLWEYV